MLTSLVFLAGITASAPCESLKSVALSNGTIASVQLVAAGPYTAPAPGGAGGRAAAPPAEAAGGRGRGGPGGGRGQGGPAAAGPIVPEHCRVAAVLTPSPDSRIAMEVWLPSSEWNGKFQFVGGGGWAGSISYAAMANALAEGYATASTDTGHVGGNALFAIDHPEKLVDFAYRAVHESTVQAKVVLAKYYGQAPRLSYWNGCSTGGRQGLMAAQRYPEDFDAIVAGAPANYQTHLHAWDLSVAVPVLRNPESAVPPAKLALLNRAVIERCDERDGVKDGLLNEPMACSFDPAVLQCKAGDAENCLTAAQVESVRRAYAPARTKSGAVVFPGKVPGSETTWTAFLSNTQQAPGISIGSFQVAYNDASWDPRTFDLERDLAVVDEKVGTIVNAVNPDLRAFKARGGKLLLYHGWNDTAISPGNSIDYYSSVLKRMGGRQEDFIRLFMAPGMAHCQGGQGPSQVNWMAALERWREAGEAPDRLLAARVTNNRVDMTRPLCPYPQVAVYKGVGSTNDAGNFVCKAR
jgi:feruloyl esterase